MFDSRVTALEADVVFNAVTGRASEEIEQLRQEYTRTIGQMDERALRASVAQDKLARALSRNSIESAQVKRATIAYRQEMAALDGQARRTTGTLAHEERLLSRFSRGALAGSGVLGKFSRAAAFASTSLLGGFGLTYALRATVSAAEEQQVALGHIQTALQNSGKSWRQYRGFIEEALTAQVRATGFTDNELAESLAGFIRRYGDVNQALRANAIAADVARAKNISLSDAQTLVMRASFGNPRSLRILGIELNKTTANYDRLVATNKHATKAELDAAKAADTHASELAALDAVQARYHGNAQRFLKTTAGRQQLFNAEVDRTKELVGTALLPTLDRFLDRGTRWLSQTKNQQRIQRDTNKAVHDGRVVLKALHGILAPVVADFRALGKVTRGTDNEIKILTGTVSLLWLRAKLIKWGVLKAGARAIGVESGAAATKVGRLSGRLAALSKLGPIALAVIVTVTYRKSIAKGLFHIPGAEDFGKYVDDHVKVLGDLDRRAGVHPTQLDPGRYGIGPPKGYDPSSYGKAQSTPGNPGGYLPLAPPGYDPSTYGKGLSTPTNPGGFLREKPGHHKKKRGGAAGGHGGGSRATKFTDVIPASLQAELAKAQYSGTHADQRAAFKDEQAFLLRQLHLAKTDAERADIYQQLAGVKGDLDALAAEDARTAHGRNSLQARRARAAARRRAAAFHARESRFRAGEDRGAAADARASRRSGVTTHAGEVRAERREETFLRLFVHDRSHDLKLRQEANSRLAQLEKHLAKIEKNTGSSAFEKQAQAFLEELSGAIRQYAPNIAIDNHYERPPEDPHAHEKAMRKAARAAFG